jgi:hypothetical protein
VYQSFASLHVRPYQLLFIVSKIGAGATEDLGDEVLNGILRRVRENHQTPLTLRANVMSVYRYQNPGTAHDTPEGALVNVKRDLDILHRLGMVPGDTRPADELFARILQNIPTAEGICGFGRSSSPTWPHSPNVNHGDYEKGVALGCAAILPPPRTADDRLRVKEELTSEMYASDHLRIRPHHLMCMACFQQGRDGLEPIDEDQVYEAVDIIQRNPDICVTLVEGCCTICPPCGHYQPGTNLCTGGIGLGLRDEKKDLDLLEMLDLHYGDTLPARELYERLFARIEDPLQICGYGDGVVRAPEWSICAQKVKQRAFAKARRDFMGIRGAKGSRKPPR